MASGFPITYMDFSGGLNTAQAPYLLSDSEARDALNVHTNTAGSIVKRPGFVTLSGSTLTGSPVNGTLVHTLFPANTSTKSLIGATRTSTTDSIIKVNQAGTASNLKTGLTANTLWYFAQAETSGGSGPIFGMNGADTPQRWDGTAGSTSDWVATTGTVPVGKFLTYYGQRLWCAGVSATPSRLFYSGFTGTTVDPLSWDANNYVDIEPNDGQAITGLGVVGPYLVVFKPRKTYVVYDLVTGAFRQINKGIGCVAPRSIVSTSVGLMFLSEDQGVCVTDGSKVQRISDTLQPTLDAVASSPSTQALAAGVQLQSRYFLSVSVGGAANDYTLEYDQVTQSWWLHDCASNAFALLDPGGTPVLYSADSTNTARVSKAFVENTFTDQGNAYTGTTYYAGPYYAWGTYGLSRRRGGYIDPHMTKRVREARFDGIGSWTTYVDTDFQNSYATIDGEIWESTADASGLFCADDLGEDWAVGSDDWAPEQNTPTEIRCHTPWLGRSASVKFVNDDPYNFKLFSATYFLQPRKD